MLEYYERFQDTRDESIEHDETKLLKREETCAGKFERQVLFVNSPD